MKLEYNLIKDSWVNVISITPVNKINTRYEELNLVVENKLIFILCYINIKNEFESIETSEWDLRENIRIKI